MNYKEVATLKEGDKVELRDGRIGVFVSDLRIRLDYFRNNKVAHIDVSTVCPDLHHCVDANNSDSRIHPCYGHRIVVWPAQIVRKI